MATDKTFNVCGISKLNGEYKVRFANDIMRIKNLAKSGHEEITLIELPNEMLKHEAAQFIKNIDEFSDVNSQSVIADYLDRHAPKAKKTAAPAKAVKAPAKAKTKSAPSKAAVDAAVAELEDAPF